MLSILIGICAVLVGFLPITCVDKVIAEVFLLMLEYLCNKLEK